MSDHLTLAERRILNALADGEWHTERELRTTREFLRRLYERGMISGAIQSLGGTPDDRLWKKVEAQ